MFLQDFFTAKTLKTMSAKIYFVFIFYPHESVKIFGIDIMCLIFFYYQQ